MSIQALDTKTLNRLNVTDFLDYAKFIPSVSFQSSGPNTAQVYMRGISSGDNGNHSGPLPTVGTYLDEMPITTIGGTLDVHVYDIARVEVLPGPQGTLYGASSEAGTLRIITNQPTTSGFSAAYDAQVNQVSHGGTGYTLEGYVNEPLSDKVAIRLVAFDEHDAGYIDNVLGARTFATSGDTFNNAGYVKRAYNTVDTAGGRAALKVDLDENWTIEPSFVGQADSNNGDFGYEPGVGFLQVQRFQPDTYNDWWGLTSLAINGKIGKYSLTYAGGYFLRQTDSKSDYTDYSISYDQNYGSGYFWQDANGNPLNQPIQDIYGKDRYTKQSHELRISSPSTDRFRIIAGAFEQRQTHWIIQDYQIQGFGPQISVPGWPNTIWLTDQMRIDQDTALFGEASYDITPQLTLTAGVRGYTYRNSLEGFFGFSENYDALTGFNSGMGSTGQNCISSANYRGDPCVNLDKTVQGAGETHKVNLTYKFTDDKLVYATYSTGYRPGGVNRNGNFGPYQADTLDNYEAGWKTSWFNHSLRFNGAVYFEQWNNFQYSFLGPNALTIIENGPTARVYGVESTVDWRATDNVNVTFNGAYNDARMVGALCSVNLNPCPTGDVTAPSGQQLPYTPAFKGNVTVRYTFPLGAWDAHVQSSLLYQTTDQVGLRLQDVANYGTIDPYGTVDFSVGADKGSVSAELYIKNAFNSDGELNRQNPFGYLYIIPVQPMTVGLKIGQKF